MTVIMVIYITFSIICVEYSTCEFLFETVYWYSQIKIKKTIP